MPCKVLAPMLKGRLEGWWGCPSIIPAMETRISTSPHGKFSANERTCLKETAKTNDTWETAAVIILWPPGTSKWMFTGILPAVLSEAHLQSQHSTVWGVGRGAWGVGVGQKQEKGSKYKASLGYTAEFQASLSHMGGGCGGKGEGWRDPKLPRWENNSKVTLCTNISNTNSG